MKLTIEQKQLSDLLSRAAAVVERRNTVPILSHVKLEAVDGALKATATDMDIEITCEVAANVSETGSTTVSAGLLFDIVKRLSKGGLLNIYLADEKLHLTCGKSAFVFATLPVDEFPAMASAEYEKMVTLQATEIAPIFNLTAFAVSNEETRYYLNGVYMHVNADGFLSGVATNGHLCALMETETVADVNSIIVPSKTVDQLRKLLVDGEVELSTSETKLRIEGDGYTIVSKVVDGVYPDFARIIPTSSKTTAVLSAKDMAQSAALVAAVGDERVRAVKLSLSGDHCTLSVTSGLGMATDEIECVLTGDAIDTAYNAKYLAAIMSVAESGEVTVGINSQSEPCLVTYADRPGLKCVAMPMRM